jgi:NADPH:quinone reductase-like Zn-dependent oxidoreductase
VLVRVHAASINTADLEHMTGTPFVTRIAVGWAKPRNTRPGIDVAGVVEAVGPGVTRFSVGDRVWADMFPHRFGSFAEYVCASEAGFELMPAISFDQAASVPHSGVLALQSLTARGPIRAGQRVLINGAGGCVGPFAIQLAKSFGAEVTAVDNPEKIEFMRSLGADHVLDYTKVDVCRTGEKYDHIVNIAARRSVFAFRRILAPGGSYTLIARNLSGFFGAALFGLFAGKGRRMGVFNWVPSRPSDLEHLGRLIVSGDVTPIIDRTYPLDELVEAIDYVAGTPADGKVVLTIGPVTP